MQPKRTSPRPRVARDCRGCGAPFFALVSTVEKGGGRYCNLRCSHAHAKTDKRPLAERFAEYVDRDGPIPSHRPDLGACWLWTGFVYPDGYGQFNAFLPGKRAHRASWSIAYGPIPDGQKVCHHCDVRRCVRPTHLFLGTQSENMLDAQQKGRVVRPMTTGTSNGNSILTENDVREIRRLRSSGVRVKALALRFQVSVSAIGSIIYRKHWKHIE